MINERNILLCAHASCSLPFYNEKHALLATEASLTLHSRDIDANEHCLLCTSMRHVTLNTG